VCSFYVFKPPSWIVSFIVQQTAAEFKQEEQSKTSEVSVEGACVTGAGYPPEAGPLKRSFREGRNCWSNEYL